MIAAFHSNFAVTMWWLLVFHAVADFWAQSDFMAMAKNHNTPVGKLFWPYALGAHALIHGAFVVLVTGYVWMGVAEAICHALIDRVKCNEKISLHVDQALHFLCKLLWAFILLRLLP
jgi:hypothetical protein